MKTIERIFKHLNEEKVELKAERVELSAIIEMQNKYKKGSATAKKLLNDIQIKANNLSAASMILGTIKSQFNKIEKTAKELGVELPNNIKSLGKDAEDLARVCGKAASDIVGSVKSVKI